MPPQTFLIADIGGTNARFALADTSRGQPLIEASIGRYAVADFPTLEAAANEFLQQLDTRPRHAILAVAGHIHDNQVQATNSPWRISARSISASLHLETARLINDFAAQSLCLPLLGEDAIARVGMPRAPTIGASEKQTFAVIGPGTGLGVGALLQREGRFDALETEGGHAGFAPEDAQEVEILRYLASRFGRVSNERLICGEGLTNLHQALAAIAGQTVDALTPEQITAHAAAGDNSLCVQVVERFCAIFGSVVGDAVLALGGWDGAFLAGGLPPRLLPWLETSAFRRRFEAKGRLADAMRHTPTVVITHPHAGLLGAAAGAVVAARGRLSTRSVRESLHGSE